MQRELCPVLVLVMACGPLEGNEVAEINEAGGGLVEVTAVSTVGATSAGGTGGESASTAGGEEPARRMSGPPPCYADANSGDGTCTRTIRAEVGLNLSGSMSKVSQACPMENFPPDAPLHDSEIWYVVAHASAATAPLTKSRRNSYLSFDTAGIDPEQIEEARLVVHHVADAGFLDNVLLFAGSVQPLFGAELGVEDFEVPTTLLGLASRALIHAHGAARWEVSAAQINGDGHTQLMLMLDRYCLNFGITSNHQNNYWAHLSPTAADPAKRPTLTVRYRLPSP